MVERGLNANHMMITEFTINHKMDAIDIAKHLSRLYDRVDQLQGQIYDLQNQNWMGRTCVYVHHVDKDAFLKCNIDPDPDELDMLFECCTSYAELLEQVRKDLNWMDPSDVIEFDGRRNVGFGMQNRWKTTRVNSKQRWLAYKEKVAESLDKALELFATEKVDGNLHLDLNRVASLIIDGSPPRVNEEANIKPILTQRLMPTLTHNSKIQHEPLQEECNEHDDDENDDIVLHDNSLRDLDKYYLHEIMDHSILYSRGYASESDDDGLDEEVYEEGFTAKEAKAFMKMKNHCYITPPPPPRFAAAGEDAGEAVRAPGMAMEGLLTSALAIWRRFLTVVLRVPARLGPSAALGNGSGAARTDLTRGVVAVPRARGLGGRRDGVCCAEAVRGA
ncbi:hypothetical protein D1007_59333 [Hordeum vulgare]|nr:hypothetical protein D1007_59333 [Hordeum vulgare]